MLLGLISILVLTFIYIRKTTRKKPYDFGLLSIIFILCLTTLIQYFYSVSDLHVELLKNKKYFIIFIVYEVPAMIILLAWPFYKLILEKIFNKGINFYLKDVLSNFIIKIVIGLKELLLGIMLILIYSMLLSYLENLIFNIEIFVAQESPFRDSLIKISDSYTISFLFVLDELLLYPFAEELFFIYK